jgi:hypothetical protein
MKWKPMAGYFGPKLKWVESLAEKRPVTFDVVDETEKTNTRISSFECYHSSGTEFNLNFLLPSYILF